MKRNSTQPPSSGTTPISFAAAAQKNTTKATPPAQTPATTTPQPVQPAASSAATVSASASAPATQTPSSTATTSSSGSQAAASPSTPSTPSKQQSAPRPVSTANGNYSAVAAKANAANRRSQVPPAAAPAVKGTPAKAASPAVSQTTAPAATPAPVSGSSASSIRFGSINDSASGSEPTAAQDGAASAASAGASMTFGSIAASGKIPSSKTEEGTSTENTQAPAHAPEHQNTFKHPQHVPQPHLAHGHHNSHRRTDSTSSAHNEHPHYRAQVPPTLSQAPMVPPMGVPQSGPASFTSQRPPLKNQGGMGPMNPQSQHHGMHPHPQQWQQSYYVPSYDSGPYYQPMFAPPPMTGYGVPPPQRPMSARPFNPSAASFTPGSKRIAIIDPNTNTEVKPLPAAVGSPSTEAKVAKNPVVIDLKNPEEEKKTIITPPPVKNAIKIVNPADREREVKERKEKEEKERLEKEEKERLEREEKERIEREAKEAEERRIREEQEEKERVEAAARAEKERKEKEALELKEKEEREERERVEAERKRKEDEERIAREKAEAEAEKARLEKEKAELEAKEKLEAERRIALETEKLAEKVKQEEVAAEAAAKAEAEKATSAAAATDAKPLAPAVESLKAGLSVDLARTVSAPTPSPSARIDNFGAVSYPSHIQSPSGADAQGKFRYDRDFLMQFMNVCKEKPDSLPALDVLADGNDRGMPSPGGPLRGNSRGPVPNGRGKPSTPMGSFGLGNMSGMRMGSMPMGGRNPSGDSRMHRSPSDNNFLPRNGLSRPPSGRGSRGGKRGGGPGRGGDRYQETPQLTIPLADIVPLEKTENAWTPSINAAPVPITTEEPLAQDVVARKVKGLLNKLTLEKFNSISDKILEIANLSVKESDGTTLKHCIQIIFEKATDEPNFGSVYAQLCHKLLEKVSNDIKDAEVEGSTGGKLFRKYLLHRCQEEFMKGWKDKTTAGGASLGDKDGPDLMSDEYYVLMKAKRQGLGLIQFIGELFKLSMLTEKIMHECIKKLLANVKEPEEEETEGLCKLLTTVGLQLDRPQAKPHMDVYFLRMAELTKTDKLPSRIRFMVQDVIDLRENKWVNRRAASGPKTIAAIHEEAAKQAEEKEMMRRTASSGGGRGLPNRREQLSRGPSFRAGSGDARYDNGGVAQVGADGWSMVGSTPAPPKKAGDLSSFGNTSRSKGGMPSSLGPQAAVFGSLAKGKRAEAKAATQNEAPRPIGSANPFDALEGENGDRRGSVDAEKPVERPRLKLLPRSAPPAASEAEASSATEPVSAAPKKTEDEAKRSIANTLKEYLSIRDMNELLLSAKELDACYRPLFVTEFVNQSMEMKQSDVDSIAEIFKKMTSESVISAEEFETGFADPLEFLADTAIDVPNAYKYAAQLLEAAGLDPAKANP